MFSSVIVYIIIYIFIRFYFWMQIELIFLN